MNLLHVHSYLHRETHACGCLPKMDSNRDDTYLSNVILFFKVWALVEIAFSLLELRKQERLTCFWSSIHLFICPSIYPSIYPPYPFIYCSSHHIITYPLVHNLSTHVPTHSLIHTAFIYLFNIHTFIHPLIHPFNYLTHPSYLCISFLPCFLTFLPSSSLLLFS